jgi:hypothetical protein
MSSPSSSELHWAGMAIAPHGSGYWLAAPDGEVLAFGSARPHGSALAAARRSAIAAIAVTNDGHGYWLATASGSVLPFGNAVSHGSAPNQASGHSIVGMAVTPDGRGYWLVSNQGAVYSFGDAHEYGDGQGTTPFVGIAPTLDGHGYWLVDSNGEVSSFGDAHNYGSLAARDYSAPIVGIASSADSHGYLLAASNGGVFTFGAARFHGSAGGSPIAYPIAAIAALPSGDGYWLLPTEPAGLVSAGPGFVAGHVTAIGDSVLLDAAPDLQTDIPGIDIEADVGRQWYTGIAVVQQLKAEGRLGATVIIDLGTNGPVDVTQFQSMMQVLSGASRVVFVTVHLPPSYSWSKSVNATLEEEVPNYSNARLANFNALADAHPRWFGSDGVHMAIGGVGAQAMARLITSVAKGP